MVGGDFNSVVSGTLDRYPPRVLGPALCWLPDFLEAFGLIDTWRAHHPTRIQYTFHSGAHNSLSRIDYCLIPTSQLATVQEIKRLARRISDHSPIWMRLTLGTHSVGRTAPTNLWYLRNPKMLTALLQAIDSYFQENDGSVDSAQTLWEAFKTVIGGQALSLIAGAKKDKMKDLVKAEERSLKARKGGGDRHYATNTASSTTKDR